MYFEVFLKNIFPVRQYICYIRVTLLWKICRNALSGLVWFIHNVNQIIKNIILGKIFKAEVKKADPSEKDIRSKLIDKKVSMFSIRVVPDSVIWLDIRLNSKYKIFVKKIIEILS